MSPLVVVDLVLAAGLFLLSRGQEDPRLRRACELGASVFVGVALAQAALGVDGAVAVSRARAGARR